MEVGFCLKSGGFRPNGEMAEWSNAAVLKTVRGASSSGVRIPLSPPIYNFSIFGSFVLAKATENSHAPKSNYCDTLSTIAKVLEVGVDGLIQK